MSSNYLISIPGNTAAQTGTIHDPSSKLKVKVVNLFKNRIKPRQGEVRYFVTAGKKKLAFETSGYNKHKNLHILQMIAMYCLYMGLLEAKIHPGWPI